MPWHPEQATGSRSAQYVLALRERIGALRINCTWVRTSIGSSSARNQAAPSVLSLSRLSSDRTAHFDRHYVYDLKHRTRLPGWRSPTESGGSWRGGLEQVGFIVSTVVLGLVRALRRCVVV